MRRSGHKTRSVFERYNISTDADDREAARKMEVYLNSQTATENGDSYGVSQPKVVNFQERD